MRNVKCRFRFLKSKALFSSRTWASLGSQPASLFRSDSYEKFTPSCCAGDVGPTPPRRISPVTKQGRRNSSRQCYPLASMSKVAEVKQRPADWLSVSESSTSHEPGRYVRSKAPFRTASHVERTQVDHVKQESRSHCLVTVPLVKRFRVP